MNETKSKGKNDLSLFKLVHMAILEIAKCHLKINNLETLLKDKSIFKPEELKLTWDAILDNELKRVFEEIETNIGFENVKLTKKNNEYRISSL